jgi:UDP-N-acetylglucosamine--N-acetylmuramyl-(pentapeptide) pyrophosphoryl-undecaprenol N-acetylglucosamine transferase
MRGAASMLAAIRPRLVITHQAGPADADAVRQAYAAAGVEARVEAFLDPVAPEMRAAQIVLCRAGATTIAELAAVGRASVLVPLATSTDDHQRRNAELIAGAEATELLAQRDLQADVAERLGALARDPARRTRMAGAIKQFAHPEAARTIVDRALRLVRA